MNSPKTLCLIVAGILALAVPIALGASEVQAPAEPVVFKTVSIKPDTTSPVMILYCHGADSRPTRAAPLGSCVFRVAPLLRIIAFAYDIPYGGDIEQKISGGPSWLNIERYDIEAKAAPTATEAELKSMLQGLLASRFKLSFHRISEAASAYALRAAKGGPRLIESQPDKTPYISVADDGRLVAQNEPMSELAATLNTVLNRSVADRTNLAKGYDFTLTWSPEGDQFGGHSSIRNAPAPFLFNALQEQLGLQLEAQKGQSDILIIDHVERPSPN